MTEIYIVNSQKGGSLKTTISSNLACLFAKKKKTLLIDLDAQSDISLTFKNEADLFLYDFLINNENINDCIYKINKNLDIIFTDERMLNYDIDLFSIKNINYVNLLNDKLENLKNEYDVIIFDTSPSFSVLLLQVFNLKFADKINIIIPFQPEFFGLKNLIRQINQIENINNKYNTNLEICSVIATKISNNNLHKTMLEAIKNYLDSKNIYLSKFSIKNTIKYAENQALLDFPISYFNDAELTKEQIKLKKTYVDIFSEL